MAVASPRACTSPSLPERTRENSRRALQHAKSLARRSLGFLRRRRGVDAGQDDGANAVTALGEEGRGWQACRQGGREATDTTRANRGRCVRLCARQQRAPPSSALTAGSTVTLAAARHCGATTPCGPHHASQRGPTFEPDLTPCRLARPHHRVALTGTRAMRSRGRRRRRARPTPRLREGSGEERARAVMVVRVRSTSACAARRALAPASRGRTHGAPPS